MILVVLIRLLVYLPPKTFQYFDYECRKRFVYTKLDIYVFIFITGSRMPVMLDY